MKKVVFVSGVHGSGKGTLCRSLNDLSCVKSYSASDLIKNNSDYIEDSKLVDNAEKKSSGLNSRYFFSERKKVSDRWSFLPTQQ